MAIIVNYDLDELDLNNMQNGGFTTIKLYVSNSPDGVFLDTSVSPSPATLADAVTAGLPYAFTFTCPNQNPSQWFKVVAYDGSTTSSLSDAKSFHGGGGTNLKAIRQRLGKATRLMLTGTTTSDGDPDGSTAICENRSFKRFRDNYFGGITGTSGWILHRLTDNTWSEISGWVQSTGTFTFVSEFDSQVEQDELFEIWAMFTPDEVRDAINWAVVNSYPTLSVPIIDTSLLTEEDRFTYTIPNNIRILNKVEIESDSFTDSEDQFSRGQPWRLVPYDVLDDGLTRQIEFKIENRENARLRITGTAMLTQMSLDTDYTEAIDPQIDVIVNYAAFRLYQLLQNDDSSTDVLRWKDRSSFFADEFEKLKRRAGNRRKPKMMWQQPAKWNSQF